mmetsp:Transcript_51651/g.102665  ORF Transcript_51651/g.102665 Transcript_51651/m.102665 type:complete len:391 (-) Transcript_51651:8-1180(-)
MSGKKNCARLADMSPNAVAAWCDTLGGIIPAATRSKLSEHILDEGLDGLGFSVLTNQHALGDLPIQGFTLAMAQKVRRCWHTDFPASASVQAAACQEQRPPASPMPSAAMEQRDEVYMPQVPPLKPTSHMPTSVGIPQPIGGFHLDSTLELLRASLDCVAERAGLDRQEVYLWVHNAIPNEVWQPLWDSVTADMLGNRYGVAPGPPPSARNAVDVPRRPAATRPRSAGAVERGTPAGGSWDPGLSPPPATARSVAGYSAVYTERSEAESAQSQAVAAWLEGDSGAVAGLTPLELVEWLRMLPAGKVNQETKKTVARRVMEQQLDGQDFQDIIDGNRWREISVHDEREISSLTRLFRQKQRETVMAEAAREAGKLNRNIQKQGMKGERINC